MADVLNSRTRSSLEVDDYKTEGRLLGGIHRLIIVVSLVLLVVVTVWFIVSQYPVSADLVFTPYALLSGISAISMLAALYLVARLKRHSTMLIWLSLLILSLFTWSLSDVILRLSAGALTAGIWAPLSTVGTAFIPTSLYMFALAYTGSRRALHPLTFVSAFSVSLLLLFVDMRTNLIDIYTPDGVTYHPWGFVQTVGTMYPIFLGWFTVLGLAALIQLILFWRRTTEPAMRSQAKIVTIAITIPLGLGTITDGLLPTLGYYGLPPLAPFLTTLMGLVISYGVLRYKYFTFTPDIVAGEILASMSEGVIGVGSNFRVSYVNAGAVHMLGYSQEEFSKMYFDGLFVQRLQLSEIEALFGKALEENGRGTINSVDLHRRDATTITVKMSITKVVDDGQPYGYLIVLTDITTIAHAQMIIEKQVAEQTEEIRQTKAQLVSSMNSLEFGFMITDNQAAIVMVNNVAHELFCGEHDHGASDCKAISLAHIEKEHISGVHFTDAVRRCIIERHSQTIKSVVFNNRTWRVFVSPVIDGNEVRGTAVIVQDVTEEHILARSRDEFFSIASHELRTPLTAIKGNTSIMLEYFAEKIQDKELRSMIADIHESSNRLIEIVNDFLEVSRLEQGRISFRLGPVSVAKIAEKVVYDMGSTARKSKVHVKLGDGLSHHDESPEVLVDAARLNQILYNLVGNAVKFTPHGTVTISAATSGDMLRITVTDTGRGIAPDMQPLLFHKFQQAGESILTRDSTKGTGLGLYISRLMARGMDGDLTLQSSEPGKGSTFLLTLPLATKERLRALNEHSKDITELMPVEDTA